MVLQNLSGRSELRIKSSPRYEAMCSIPHRVTSATARIQNLHEGFEIGILDFKMISRFLKTIVDEPVIM